ncbi:HAD hydrolase-like protein [Paenarthrobacter sp. Z7-10]|uniref:HAD hydrolase-like protein n=1 Tax=Paenarthrobacter sp. Z7-10 TaxID=2787635 RepID=UPI0022A9DB60|nr:HAD hydrolase-like protein [Paenarthrobacter sp. Z7-10]
MTNSAPAVLFDLDGTLVDPAGGITTGIAHALSAMNLQVPAPEVLASMVGPKLSDSLLALTDATNDQIPELIRHYRHWYADRGIGMGRVYPGIRDALETLRADGVRLGAATQKPEGLAATVLQAHGLAGYFEVIAGSASDETLLPGQAGYRSGKAGIIAAALDALSGGHARIAAVMVGDRAQDVDGATANGLDCIGVQWGFAPAGELAAAGAAVVVGDARELLGELDRRLEVQNASHGAY